VEIVSSALTGHNLGDFHLHDISGGGTSAVGPYKLGEVDSQVKLRLRFDLQSTGKSEDAEMTGTIQSVELVNRANQADSTTQYQHGIRFHELDARVVLLAHEPQQHHP
jgi:hypothetical protein